jgi:hypothetical protein
VRDVTDFEPQFIQLKRMPVAVRKPPFPSTPSLLTLPSGITDKVAKESKDSNASTHELHDSEEANQATSGGGAHANAHKANPVRKAGWLDSVRWGLTTRQGPVHADNLPTPESKADLKKRAEELNK